MFNLADMSVDEILQHIVTLRQDESERRFVLGELCDHAVTMGIKASEIAGYINCSEGYIRQIVKTWKAFPSEEDRIPYSTLPYQCFKLAAYTDRPTYWMDRAADQEWSTREMSKAIKGEAVEDETRTADRIYGTVERCIEAGGPGAKYLYDKIEYYLRGIDYVRLCAGAAEAGEEKEEAEEATL